EPGLKYAAGLRLYSKLHICKWDDFDAERAQLLTAIGNGAVVSQPFEVLALSSSPAEQLKAAQIYIADRFPAANQQLAEGARYSHDRIRVAYLSADLRDHAVAF